MPVIARFYGILIKMYFRDMVSLIFMQFMENITVSLIWIRLK